MSIGELMRLKALEADVASLKQQIGELAELKKALGAKPNGDIKRRGRPRKVKPEVIPEQTSVAQQ